jgi:hypothetical protein
MAGTHRPPYVDQQSTEDTRVTPPAERLEEARRALIEQVEGIEVAMKNLLVDLKGEKGPHPEPDENKAMLGKKPLAMVLTEMPNDLLALSERVSYLLRSIDELRSILL